MADSWVIDPYKKSYIDNYLKRVEAARNNGGNPDQIFHAFRNPASSQVGIDTAYTFNDDPSTAYLREGLIKSVFDKYGMDAGDVNNIDSALNYWGYQVPSSILEAQNYGNDPYREGDFFGDLIFNPAEFEKFIAKDRYDPTKALYGGVSNYGDLTKNLLSSGLLQTGKFTGTSGSGQWDSRIWDNPYTSEVERLAIDPGSVPLFGSGLWARPENQSVPILMRNPQDIAGDTGQVGQIGQWSVLDPEWRKKWLQTGPNVIAQDGNMLLDVTPYQVGANQTYTGISDPNAMPKEIYNTGWREEDEGGLGFLGNLAALGLYFVPGFQALAPALQGALIGGAGGLLSTGELDGALKGAALGGIGGYAGGQLFGGDAAALGVDQVASSPAALDEMLGISAGQGFTPAAGLNYTPTSSIGSVFDATLPSIGSSVASAIPSVVGSSTPSGGMLSGIDDLGQLGYPQGSMVDPMTGGIVPGSSVPVTDWASNSPGMSDFLKGLGFSDDVTTKVIGGMGKLGSAITADPFRAASLAMTAGGLLQNKLNPPQEETYTPTPVDRSIVDKYGKVPSLGQVNYQPLQYQGFQNLGVNQGLLNSRLNQMKGLI